mmetsp:Transcript_35587/g.109734  ORF Transcript_35587/g.109734 Transcript_35587/m.109734 type:complete len:205 (+) Transcript_35587:252-866(+)
MASMISFARRRSSASRARAASTSGAMVLLRRDALSSDSSRSLRSSAASSHSAADLRVCGKRSSTYIGSSATLNLTSTSSLRSFCTCLRRKTSYAHTPKSKRSFSRMRLPTTCTETSAAHFVVEFDRPVMLPSATAEAVASASVIKPKKMLATWRRNGRATRMNRKLSAKRAQMKPTLTRHPRNDVGSMAAAMPMQHVMLSSTML